MLEKYNSLTEMNSIHHLMLEGGEKAIEPTEKVLEKSEGKRDKNICSKSNQEEDFMISSGGETEDEVYTDCSSVFKERIV